MDITIVCIFLLLVIVSAQILIISGKLSKTNDLLRETYISMESINRILLLIGCPGAPSKQLAGIVGEKDLKGIIKGKYE